MRPLQGDLRCPAPKDNSLTHTAAAPSNLDAATTMRSADTELQSTIERRATASEIAAPTADLGDSWRCENEAFVRDILQNLQVAKRSFRARPPSNSDSWRCENVAFVRDLPENLKVEHVKTKLSCETSLKIWKMKMWKRSFRARLETSLKIWKLKMWNWSFRARPPSKSESWRCENEAFVRDIPEKVKVEDVKAKLSCETSFKFRQLKMWNWSFRARPPSKSESWRCENEAFVRDLPENLEAEDVKTKLSCETWDVPQNLKVEDVKTKLSCETSLKIWKLKMWKRSIRARPPWKSESGRCEKEAACVRDLRRPSKSESWRCENEAFVRDLSEKAKVEDVKTKLSVETSFKFWKCKLRKMAPEMAVPLHGRSNHDRSTPEPFRNLPARQASPSIFRDTFCPANTAFRASAISQKRMSCETSFKFRQLKMRKQSFIRARPLSKSESWRCENEAFVRDLPEKARVEDVKTKLSCETSLKSEIGKCEIEVFVRDIPQKVKVEDVKLKLSCETSLKTWKWKMWQRSLAVRSLGCGISWLWDLLAVRRLVYEIIWLWDLLAVRFLGCEIFWLWDLLAVRSLGCEISWLWNLLAVRSLGCEISWLWDLLAVRSLGCEISWLWDLLAVRSLGCEISWLWDLLAVRSLGCEISWLWDLLAVRSFGCEISWLRSLGCEISWLWDLLAVRSLGCEISWLWDLLAFKSMTSKNP